MIKNKVHLNKGFVILFSFILSLFLFSNIYASQVENNNVNNEQEKSEETNSTNINSIFDLKSKNGIYKFSDDDTSYLPFIRYATDRILMDKEAGKLGLSFSLKSIEVTSPQNGIQVLFSNDTVRVNSDMEYAVILAGTNVVIDSEIKKPLIVFAGDTVTITENAKLNDDIICYASTLDIKGKIDGSVLGIINNIQVDADIKGDLRARTTNLSINENNNINGNLYVETYNKDLKLPEKYSNGTLKLLEVKEEKFDFSVIVNGIIAALLFTLVYIIVNKASKEKVFNNTITKIKENPIFTITSGALMLMLIPFVVGILILLSLVGLNVVTVPLIFIYISFLLVVGLSSTFIVGSVMAQYMNNHYFKSKGIVSSIIGTFIIFLLLYVLARIQVIGSYVVIALVMLAIGFTMTYIFKRKKSNIEKAS